MRRARRSRRPFTPLPHAETVAAIGELRSGMAGRSDRWLADLATGLRRRAESGESPDLLLEESFALMREASRRVLGLEPYDVQLAAGIALHRERVAEMQTGEGKTLAAVAPVFLNALTGRGVHVLTFNDYLARRDASWMGPLFEFLGLAVGCVQEGMSASSRQRAYLSDVTYVTAREAGFDILRDQLSLSLEDQVHRPLHFALVDEADSILIDEARVPLVIAGDPGGPEGGPARPSHQFATAPPYAPESAGLDSVGHPRRTDSTPAVPSVAKPCIFRHLRRLATRTGEKVGLGRLAEIARLLGAGVEWETDEHRRNVFLTEAGCRRVEELLGSTNLFAPEGAQLLAAVRNALHAEVLLRRDVDYIVRRGGVELVDEFTGRVADKRRWPDGLQGAVEAKEGLRLRDEGRILGSITLQHFLGLYPRLSGMTGTARGGSRELEEIYGLEVVEIPTHRPSMRIDHPDRVFITREAKSRDLLEEITRVQRSGRPVLVGTVSVRESDELADRLQRRGVACRVLNARNDEDEAAVVAEAGRPGAVTISTNMAGRGTDIRLGGSGGEERRRVAALGGLYVIGTHRHESRRIDDQLRGRAGRQGDPGSSRFILSLEDDLLARYGIRDLVPVRLLPEGHDGAIDHPVIHREIARVQRIVEGESGDIRRRLYDYSSRIETQRRLLAEWRQGVLDGSVPVELVEKRSPARRATLRETVPEGTLREVERRLTLVTLDRCWSEHLAELQRIRDELHFVTFDGRVPLVEFCRIAADAFEEMLREIDDEIVAAFETLPIGPEGVDWQATGLRGPSATWTYLVSDSVFGDNTFLALAVRPSFFMGAVMIWPVLFLWALYQHWARRRKRSPSPPASA